MRNNGLDLAARAWVKLLLRSGACLFHRRSPSLTVVRRRLVHAVSTSLIMRCAGFEACSRPQWRQDQNATSAGRQQRVMTADVGGTAAWPTTNGAGIAVATAQPDSDAVSERPSSQVALQAGPADVASPSTAAASSKRRRDRRASKGAEAPKPQRRCLRSTSRVATAAGVQGSAADVL